MDRQQTVETMKAKLDKWNADLKALEGQAAKVSAEKKAELHGTLTDLKAKKDKATRELDQLQNASEDAFDSLSRGMEQAWDRVSESFQAARKRFH